ncbi:MAG: polyhydroxyalkanoate depolymerase [Rhodoblastus sp.]|nr:polyhydroxyalkanoate depolymerase [Rhodoblastus sp.]MCB9997972.1 polyhydroxyalkanoate depolymerase [Methylobacteriaceae bacterium]MCC2099820.1 polyhydroxyalkanoate depolymerase [Hyphomicrobiales bacterium]MCB1524234.1 polyhydroxyalkanoate depolymerase [Rhodoblastus sp.]MCC2109885.1 polyhydroxyalkanoate depolymerase [Hyphomicrobiales bacterium]
MMYYAYQAQDDLIDPFRVFAQSALDVIENSWLRKSGIPFLGNVSAAYELMTRARLTHHRPPYRIDKVKVGNREVAVTEEVTYSTPFGSLLRFRKDIDIAQPKVLVVAPLSGHFATLLRNTVQVLLADNDVFITDWHNARDVPLSAGEFGMEGYISHVIDFMEKLGPRSHIVAVCQPCVQALAATAIMSEDNNPATPASLTLMAGPIDTRLNPTKVNHLATTKPIEWFEKNLIALVPGRFKGGGRLVYPGFMQLTAFMSMNLDRHVKAHVELYNSLAAGEMEKAQQTKTFYDEYFAVLDLTAEFYIETVKLVFQDYALAKGELQYKGRTVNPKAIRRTTLLTVEGERDDICSVGQTLAAHDLCSSLKPFRKRHHLQPGVGHYGVFSGKKWENQIYPLVRNAILSSE